MALLFIDAIDGFLLALAAEGKSPHTMADYSNSLGKLDRFLGEIAVEEIGRDDVRGFLASLEGKLSAKTRRNVHTALSSFWSWAVGEGYVHEHVIKGIKPPRAPHPLIEPYSEEQVRAMLRACQRSRGWFSERAGRDTSTRRPTALRDRALVLFLLDTGIRASELCMLEIQDVDLNRGRAVILRGKGRKQRRVSFGRRVRQALWRYWATREDTSGEMPVFATVLDGERPLNRDVLYRLVARIGDRAGVPKASPHRFRHTFSINYLRNGGDIFTLQKLLGHSSLDMVRRYARIAESDTERVHERASPVDNWRL